MGKVLVIKDVDFSMNAVDVISISGDSLIKKKSGVGVFFLDYNNAKNIQTTKSSPANKNSILYVFDVRNAIGKTLQITSANPVIENAYYDCFSSDLGQFSFNDITSLVGGSNVSYPITVISTFNVSNTALTKNTITKIVPNGAKYMLITLRIENMQESEFNVTVLD